LFLACLAAGVLSANAEGATDDFDDSSIVEMLDGFNSVLLENDKPYAVESVSMYTDADHAAMGRTIFASDHGNKQLGLNFIPGDPRRAAWGDTSGTGITMAVDSFEGSTSSGLSADATSLAIISAMESWNDVQCSDIPLIFADIFAGMAPFDIGLTQWLLGFGGLPFIGADIVHGGWLPQAFFDLLGGSEFTLAMTITFTFVSDGALATKEIYYNDAFPWEVNGDNFDVETVALHEIGHALGQDHFGDISANPAGQVIFAPLAVMNSAYSRVQRELTGTDVGGHCSIWGSWPNGDGGD
jgi:hypothetical protein